MFQTMPRPINGGGGSNPTDILNWTYVDKVVSPSFASSSWSYTFDFSTYKYWFVVDEFGTLNYYFFDNTNIAQKVTNETPVYPVTVSQSGNSITFSQPVNATSIVSIYRYTG